MKRKLAVIFLFVLFITMFYQEGYVYGAEKPLLSKIFSWLQGTPYNPEMTPDGQKVILQRTFNVDFLAADRLLCFFNATEKSNYVLMYCGWIKRIPENRVIQVGKLIERLNPIIKTGDFIIEQDVVGFKNGMLDKDATYEDVAMMIEQNINTFSVLLYIFKDVINGADPDEAVADLKRIIKELEKAPKNKKPEADGTRINA